MPSLKTLRPLGIAAILAASGTGIAPAADMRGVVPPPPPPMIAPPPAYDVGGGFYLRGDVGMGLSGGTNVRYSPPPAGFAVNQVSSSISDSLFLGAGAGYAFNSWFRADATIEYRSRLTYKLTELTTTDPGNPLVTPGSPGINIGKGRMSAIVGLANAYVDLGTWHRITPFVGAGVGFATLMTGGVTDHGYGQYAGGFGRASDRTQTNFAWAVHAGLGYDLGGNWKAEAGYRYLNMGKANTGTIVCTVPCTPYHARLRNIDSHDLKVGLRYVFAESAPAFMPGPLIRKY